MRVLRCVSLLRRLPHFALVFHGVFDSETTDGDLTPVRVECVPAAIAVSNWLASHMKIVASDKLASVGVARAGPSATVSRPSPREESRHLLGGAGGEDYEDNADGDMVTVLPPGLVGAEVVPVPREAAVDGDDDSGGGSDSAEGDAVSGSVGETVDSRTDKDAGTSEDVASRAVSAQPSRSSSGRKSGNKGGRPVLSFPSTVVAIVGTREQPAVMGGHDLVLRAFTGAMMAAEEWETFGLPLHVSYPAGSIKYYCPQGEVSRILAMARAAAKFVGPAVTSPSAPPAPVPLPVLRLVVTSEASMHRIVAALAVLHQSHLSLMQGTWP